MPLQKQLTPMVVKFIYRNDLNMLAYHFETDKWGKHWYTQHYQRYFQALKNKPIKLLEIGVGGYKEAGVGAESLRLWKAYFPKGRIVGLDLEDKRHFMEDRIDIRMGDQTDAKLLKALCEEYGGFDIIIDDGSHLNHHVIETFQVLFPLLNSPGIYSIEDTQTACWPGWGGGMQSSTNSTAFFKGLTDGLNHVEYPVEGYEPTYFDKNITEMSFFHNLIIIRKGDYGEKTNAPDLVAKEIAM